MSQPQGRMLRESSGETLQFVRISGSQRIASSSMKSPSPTEAKDCRGFFSVKTGTVCHRAKLTIRACLYAISSCQLARPIAGIHQTHLHGAIREKTNLGSTICTDGHRADHEVPEHDHQAVQHSVGEHVNGMARTDGIESFLSLRKRGCNGTHHHFSTKCMGRYVEDFSTRKSLRHYDTMPQIDLVIRDSRGKPGYAHLSGGSING